MQRDAQAIIESRMPKEASNRYSSRFSKKLHAIQSVGWTEDEGLGNVRVESGGSTLALTKKDGAPQRAKSSESHPSN